MSYCKNCGNALVSDAAICTGCGVWVSGANSADSRDFCPNCGTKAREGIAICGKCKAVLSGGALGYGGKRFSNNPNGVVVSSSRNPGKGFSIASLILGIAAFAVPFGLVCAIAAVAFGVIGRRRSKLAGFTSDVATVGLILGIIALLCILVLAAVVQSISLFFGMLFNEFWQTMQR
jgi:hypothetical protein